MRYKYLNIRPRKKKFVSQYVDSLLPHSPMCQALFFSFSFQQKKKRGGGQKTNKKIKKKKFWHFALLIFFKKKRKKKSILHSIFVCEINLSFLSYSANSAIFLHHLVTAANQLMAQYPNQPIIATRISSLSFIQVSFFIQVA